MNKLMKSAIILFAAVLASSFVCPTIETSVKGHLRSKSHKAVAGFSVFVTGVGISMNNVDAAHTDKNGNFTLSFNAGSEPGVISFFCVNKHNDTLLLKRIKRLSSDSPEMTFWIK